VLLLTALPVGAHDIPIGSSRWCFGGKRMVANIDLRPTLLSELPGMKSGAYDPNSADEEELRRIASGVVQPYLDRKLSIRVNERSYPVRVDRLVRNNNLFTVWLAIDHMELRPGANAVQIDYRLLFEETGNTHLNLAYLYFSDATGETLKNLFDFSQPARQYSFEQGAPPWEITVPGGAAVASREGERGTLPGEPATAALPRQGARGKAAGTPLPKGATPAAASAAPGGAADPQVRVAAPLPATGAPAPVRGGGSRDPGPGGALPGQDSLWSCVSQFLPLGIEHILTGYDHIAFLVALIVIGLSTREVLKIITAFTVAHSITLLLAALQIVNLDSKLVESSIALSICYVALENLFRKRIQYRWAVTFCFGLIHGFGFASALQELMVGRSNLMVSVLSFNLGVETGQLMIFLLLLPLLHFLKRTVESKMVTAGASLAVFLLGFTWLVERIFDLKLLPFGT